jgi:uncharacterized protein (TIGR00299 family) protein
MKLAYVNCPAGVSGNMLLGALLDAGLSLAALEEGLAGLQVSGYEIVARKVHKRGISGTHVHVRTSGNEPERHLSDILEIIEGGTLPAQVKAQSQAIFTRLAQAEARVHGETIEDIHFHEVGGLDAIVDIVGSALGFSLLGIERIYSSALHLGTGTVQCAHGLLPLPAPATLELLKGVPVYGWDVEAELVTPTGAAILTTLADSYGSTPMMRVDRVGYGAGSRDLPFPNLLRLTIGTALEEADDYDEDVVIVIETNIDDMNPEWYEQAMSRLFDAGALDVFLTPVQMKRNRPAVQVSVIAAPERLSHLLEVVFAETTTIGVRTHSVRRWKLRREAIIVETPYGPVAAKVARQQGKVVNVSPEHRDCQRIAAERDLPLKEVYQAALAAARAEVLPKRSGGE